MRKKAHHEEEGSSERWLVSYADFITLLFAFFTTLYAISTVDAQKMGKMVTSMRASFDSAVFDSGSRNLSLSQGSGGVSSKSREVLESLTPGNDLSTKVHAFKGIEEMKGDGTKKSVLNGEKDLGRFKKSVETLLGVSIAKGLVRVHLEPRGLIISLGEKGVFDSGSDQIKPDGRALLDDLAASLVSVGNYIRVEGHTDNVPIHNLRFASNWELSTARATVVVCYLIQTYRLRPEMLAAAGYSEYRPVASNDTEEGKARNRRVDIIILNPSATTTEPN
ncbi:MAG TPA: flagellar motor protein MotB [Acidobacteriota bacterium]|nr:flagellar motor protein MotB [Acidobacteriota bacterium]